MFTVTAGSTHHQLLSLLMAQFHKHDSVSKNLSFLCSDSITNLCCENSAFVARDAQDLPQNFFCSRCLSIIDSSVTALRKTVSERRIPALTCGLAGTDTFTLSSWRSESAVVCLRRTLTAFDNTKIEPFELPVSFTERPDPFSLLSATAVLCLLGKTNPLVSLQEWKLLPFAFCTHSKN